MRKARNIYYTLGANILTFIMGIVTGFIIPKFLGIESYAYVKLFTFYITYVGISHFGFLDGIYIRYGAYDYDEIPKEKFRGYFRYLLVIQIIEAIIMLVILKIVMVDIDRSFIMIWVVINMIISNLTTLFAFIHQFTKRFKVFSINLVLNKLIYVIGSLVFIYCNLLGYKPFIVLQTAINIIILCVYIYINKELVFGKCESIRDNISEYINITKSGFFIMIGNFMGIFILGLDRLFVDRFFTLNEFSMYSFAYTLISLFFILLNSITTVIYPYLARMNRDNSKIVYERIRIALTSIMSITLVGYFAIKMIINTYLPKYEASLPILIFLVPTVIYSAQINILIINYYKILQETKAYTKNNIIALLLGLVTNIVALAMFKSVVSIAAATLISFALWLLYSDYYFNKTINVNYKKASFVELLIVIVFIITTSIHNWLLGASIYSGIIIIILFICCRNEIKETINGIRENSKV
ncbi:oligosaccharide flippase family protein [Clostridium sp.]|uniref:oligosaccharide flippase family protein n=1 Tax=Clostridium sp. TaxID=1506 RepID=UPI0039927DA0